VAGLFMVEAEYALRETSIQREIYRDPKFMLRMVKPKTNQVTVIGAVDKPGVYDLPEKGSDLISALAAAGGLTEKADTIVEIRHPMLGSAVSRSNEELDTAAFQEEEDATEPGTITIDLGKSEEGSKDTRVVNGSVIMVPKKPTRFVTVLGLVRNPKQVEISSDQELRLLDALALAGGLTTELANHVEILRRHPRDDRPIVIGASISRAKRVGDANLRLAPGDVVSVNHDPLTVTVGTLRDFIRFGFGISGNLSLF
jgi:polysaccharide export outer membrane protein